ncbi:nucleotidyltransferase family protein [Pseudonocardia asaccharolytica]|uniref:Nucleotidyltransferase n=1 Tax=Pseudonocardia asaccharolytica DSM 44247 = NBRC 16224 TaxID=1123024 RepID=A0A511CWF0_9PSEU|nr:sugar phosphate nucleotidyltransferase [Pseudonocardia asaccharolytica]GEL16899.1 nucleotidyltransferase [Pseudonocardia asaccharolytica DSM 44247 = NBRC 16224]
MSELTAVIQAGGRGTRLAPYSTVLPKALMPIRDGTVIDNLLEQFSAAGVGTVLVTVSEFGPLIRSYCGDGDRWGLDIEYIKEEEPLGTIGPLNPLRQRLDGPFFVSNSDVFTDLALKDVLAEHEAQPAPLTVVVTRQTVNIAYGVLDHVAGRVVDFREKPTEEFWVSTGIYFMEPAVFDHIPPSGPFGFDQLMRAMLDSGTPVNVYEHEGRWIDIGRIEDLRRAQEQAAAALANRS